MIVLVFDMFQDVFQMVFDLVLVLFGKKGVHNENELRELGTHSKSLKLNCDT